MHPVHLHNKYQAAFEITSWLTVYMASKLHHFLVSISLYVFSSTKANTPQYKIGTQGISLGSVRTDPYLK